MTAEEVRPGQWAAAHKKCSVSLIMCFHRLRRSLIGFKTCRTHQQSCHHDSCQRNQCVLLLQTLHSHNLSTNTLRVMVREHSNSTLLQYVKLSYYDSTQHMCCGTYRKVVCCNKISRLLRQTLGSATLPTIWNICFSLHAWRFASEILCLLHCIVKMATSARPGQGASVEPSDVLWNGSTLPSETSMLK